jgi:hypothetical protein
MSKMAYVIMVNKGPLAVYDEEIDANSVKTKLQNDGHKDVEVVEVMDMREPLKP